MATLGRLEALSLCQVGLFACLFCYEKLLSGTTSSVLLLRMMLCMLFKGCLEAMGTHLGWRKGARWLGA